MCTDIRYFLNFYYFSLYISQEKKDLTSYFCQCLELDTQCYCVSENANTSTNVRENQER